MGKFEDLITSLPEENYKKVISEFQNTGSEKAVLLLSETRKGIKAGMKILSPLNCSLDTYYALKSRTYARAKKILGLKL